MAELSDLYQEVIIDHNRRPRNLRAISDADRTAVGYNPLCGDEVTLFVKLRDGVIEDIAFQGRGCAIATASASLLTTSLKGRTVAEAGALGAKFLAMLTEDGAGEGLAQEVGKLAALSGVRAFPMRVKCATLAWHTLRNALAGRGGTASTE